MTSWDRLRRLAAQQHGVFTSREALACGVSRAAIRHRHARGEVVRLHQGVYRFTGGPLTNEADLAAAVKAAGPCATCGARLGRAATILRTAFKDWSREARKVLLL